MASSEQTKIDAPTIPVQRASSEDASQTKRAHTTLEVGKAAGERSAHTPDRRLLVLVAGSALIVGLAAGIALGVVAASPTRSTVPARQEQHGDFSRLLLDPLTSDSTSPAPNDQQDLIRQILTPPNASTR